MGKVTHRELPEDDPIFKRGWSIATVTCSPDDVPDAVRNTSGRFVERFCVPVSWACCPTCRRTDPAGIGAAGTIRKRAEAVARGGFR